MIPRGATTLDELERNTLEGLLVDHCPYLCWQLLERYAPGASTTPGSLDAVNAQAAKRVGLQFVARRTASWDHRKLTARS